MKKTLMKTPMAEWMVFLCKSDSQYPLEELGWATTGTAPGDFYDNIHHFACFNIHPLLEHAA